MLANLQEIHVTSISLLKRSEEFIFDLQYLSTIFKVILVLFPSESIILLLFILNQFDME